jgi:D-inositol-3-phosphate glycosyltransferase
VRILWGSEQATRPTGYGIVTRNLVKRLVERGHEVFTMGWDYNGEDFVHEEGWTMVHSGISGYGSERVAGEKSPTVLDIHLHRLKPDCYVSLIDPWFIAPAVVSTNSMEIPYIAYLPIDGYPISSAWAGIFKMLHTPLWMSRFGQKLMVEFAEKNIRADPVFERYENSPGQFLYHGVELDLFHPIDEETKQAIRNNMGFQFDFAFLSVARNTNRKQIPRLLEAFALFLSRLKPEARETVGLVLHCGDPTDSFGSGGWDLPSIINDFGLDKNVVFSDTSSNPLHGMSRKEMGLLFQACDVHVMATGGEGFGIPSAEAMACGLPIIVPDNSTGPELVGDNERGWLVPSVTHITGPKWGVNMTLVDILKLADAMSDSYNNADEREARGTAAREFALDNFDWEKLTDKLESTLEEAVINPHPLGKTAALL